MLIFKEQNNSLPKKLKDAYDTKRIILKANKKGWMTTEIMDEWVQEVWVPNTNRNKSYLLTGTHLHAIKTKN